MRERKVGMRSGGEKGSTTHTHTHTDEAGNSPGRQILWAYSPPHVGREGGRERELKVTHE